MDVQQAREALQRELTADLPEAGTKTWYRLTSCPKCSHGDSAAVSYTLGWFKCFACHENVSVGTYEGIIMTLGGERILAGTHITMRYRIQVEAAADRAARTFQSMSRYDAVAYGYWRVCVYAGIVSIDAVKRGKGDWGKLWEWEEQVKGDPDQMDRFVSQALNTDLYDAQRRHIRRQGKEVLVRPVQDDEGEGGATLAQLDALQWQQGNVERGVTPRARYIEADSGDPHLRGYPILAMHHSDMTLRDIAQVEGITKAEVKRRIDAETQRYMAEHGIAA